MHKGFRISSYFRYCRDGAGACMCVRARAFRPLAVSFALVTRLAIFTRRYTGNNNDGAVVNIQGCNYSTIETNRAIGKRKGTKRGKKILEGGMCPRYLEDCPVPLRGEGFLISSRSPPVFRSLRVGREWEEFIRKRGEYSPCTVRFDAKRSSVQDEANSLVSPVREISA